MTKKRAESKTPVAQKKKLFVLDTNVLMDDPGIIFRLEENDVRVPRIVFGELDKHKSGLDEINRNARQATRLFDELTVEFIKQGGNLADGIPLSITGRKEAGGKIFLTEDVRARTIFDDDRSNDNKIIEIAYHYSGKPYAGDKETLANTTQKYEEVVLLSNDGNMRLTARAIGLSAESVRGDVEVSDKDFVPQNVHIASENFWETIKETTTNEKNGRLFYTLFGSFPKWRAGDFVSLPSNERKGSLFAQITKRPKGVAVLRILDRFATGSGDPWGVKPRNDEQEFALQLLMDPEIDFVSLLGIAGTGKNFLTLAAAFEQVMVKKLYDEIIVTRAMVPLDRDIGFLPGTEKEKMDPWMGAFEDNIQALVEFSDQTKWQKDASTDLLKQHFEIKSMNFMRGRTFARKFLIIDEAQNLTQKQAKTLVSRAGLGTKVVFLGNVAQIDTPYLTEYNCGLVQTIHRFRNGPYLRAGYILLERGERSPLADAANIYL